MEGKKPEASLLTDSLVLWDVIEAPPIEDVFSEEDTSGGVGFEARHGLPPTAFDDTFLILLCLLLIDPG